MNVDALESWKESPIQRVATTMISKVLASKVETADTALLRGDGLIIMVMRLHPSLRISKTILMDLPKFIFIFFLFSFCLFFFLVEPSFCLSFSHGDLGCFFFPLKQ